MVIPARKIFSNRLGSTSAICCSGSRGAISTRRPRAIRHRFAGFLRDHRTRGRAPLARGHADVFGVLSRHWNHPRRNRAGEVSQKSAHGPRLDRERGRSRIAELRHFDLTGRVDKTSAAKEHPVGRRRALAAMLPRRLTVLSPAPALGHDSITVTQAPAFQYHLSLIADLGRPPCQRRGRPPDVKHPHRAASSA